MHLDEISTTASNFPLEVFLSNLAYPEGDIAGPLVTIGYIIYTTKTVFPTFLLFICKLVWPDVCQPNGP